MKNNDILDKPKTIRKGEELDATKIGPFLKDTISGLDGPIKIRQFPSGHSNLTYAVSVGDVELVLRRPPFGHKAKTAHDMGREYRILSALHTAYPYCPKPLVYTEDESIIGCPFYVMERLKGIILRKDPPKSLNFTRQMARKLCEDLVDVHVKLHSIDIKDVGLDNFGKPQGYIKRQVDGWSKRYRQARTPDAPDCESVMEWLAANMPEGPTRAAVIHGDFKMDNVVLDPENSLKIIGVLDWEMATVGDPLMDLGCSLGYWVEKDDPAEVQEVRMMPTNMEGALTRKEIIARYSEKSGIKIDNFDFYWCFGIFRLIVIAQQIYFRFYHGQTKDQRFGQFIFAVHILEKAAMGIIEENS